MHEWTNLKLIHRSSPPSSLVLGKIHPWKQFSRYCSSNLPTHQENHLFFLHGLFGNKLNWKNVISTMTTLHSSPPNWHFTPLDLLNHGDNVKEANLFDKLTLDTLSQNVAKTILEQVNPSTTSISLLGHSLGGKVAMHLALKGFIPLHKLIVVDISPKPQLEIINHPETSKIYKYLQAMQYIASKKFTQRVDVDTYLKTVEPSLEIRHFLMTNLVWNDSSFKESYFKFRNNLQLMLNSLPEFFDFPISSQQCRPKFIGDTFFIRGNRSDYLPDKDISLLKSYFPNYSMVTLEGGHWIHSENPKDFVDTLVTILKISK